MNPAKHPLVAPSNRRTRMNREDRAAQLLSVAETVIADRGFQAVSMEEIADAAGVTKPVLYDHFESKDALLAAVVERAADSLRRAIESAVSGASSAEEMMSLGIAAYFEFVAKRTELWSIVITEGAVTRESADAIEAFRQEQAELIGPLIASQLPGSDLGRAIAYSHIIIGACERLAVRYVHDASSSTAEMTQNLLDVVWVGFSGLRYGARWQAPNTIPTP